MHLSNQKRIRNKRRLNLGREVMKAFTPGIFNRLCVNHSKNLEQRKFRTKERANNVSLFKSNCESYGCQPWKLTGSIPSSIFLNIY